MHPSVSEAPACPAAPAGLCRRVIPCVADATSRLGHRDRDHTHAVLRHAFRRLPATRLARNGLWMTELTDLTVPFFDGCGTVLGTRGLLMHLKLRLCMLTEPQHTWYIKPTTCLCFAAKGTSYACMVCRWGVCARRWVMTWGGAHIAACRTARNCATPATTVRL